MTITVYHGSSVDFDKPSLSKCKEYRDFGKGFYITQEYFDALNILKYSSGYVSEYELDLRGLSIKEIVDDEEVLDYIIKNRTEIEIEKPQYDVIIGKTATGYCSKLFKQIRNKGVEIDREDIRNRIMGDSYGLQICIKTEKGLNNLKLRDIEHFSSSDFTKL